MRIFVDSFEESGPNGDRDHEKHLYLIYKITLESPVGSMIVATFDPYERFHQVIGKGKLEEAHAYARNMARVLEADISFRRFRKQVQTSVIWEEIKHAN